MLELAVPNTRQATSYTCGPASLLSCLRYLNRPSDADATEEALAESMRCTEQAGTAVAWMVAEARRRRLSARLVDGMTDEQLREHVARGDLCILLIQAWANDATRDVPWEDDLLDGHYVVATACGRRAVYFCDPSMTRGRGRLTWRELASRWHEQENGIILRRAAIVITSTIAPKRRRLGRTSPIR